MYLEALDHLFKKTIRSIYLENDYISILKGWVSKEKYASLKYLAARRQIPCQIIQFSSFGEFFGYFGKYINFDIIKKYIFSIINNI